MAMLFIREWVGVLEGSSYSFASSLLGIVTAIKRTCPFEVPLSVHYSL